MEEVKKYRLFYCEIFEWESDVFSLFRPFNYGLEIKKSSFDPVKQNILNFFEENKDLKVQKIIVHDIFGLMECTVIYVPNSNGFEIHPGYKKPDEFFNVLVFGFKNPIQLNPFIFMKQNNIGINNKWPKKLTIEIHLI